MKEILAAIGLLFLIGVLLATLSETSNSEKDQEIKDKIAIIALAEESDDPVVKSQGEVAKIELAEIQNQKQAAILKEKQDAIALAEKEKKDAVEQAKFEASPSAQVLRYFTYAVFIVVSFGLFCLFMIRMGRPSRF